MFLFFFLFCVQSINSGENLSIPFSRQKEITLYSACVLFGGLVKYLLKILDMFHLDILINLISNWPIINSQLMWLFILVEERVTSFTNCNMSAHKHILLFFLSLQRSCYQRKSWKFYWATCLITWKTYFYFIWEAFLS